MLITNTIYPIPPFLFYPQAANLRTAQDNHKREVEKIRAEMDKRREDQVRVEKEKTLDALKMMERFKIEPVC